uniref:Uncharacterized protein n=1 Tax=Rhizophora mucronata TaxID=61149 RepID=A0A2P2NRL8_RHIMU
MVYLGYKWLIFISRLVVVHNKDKLNVILKQASLLWHQVDWYPSSETQWWI